MAKKWLIGLIVVLTLAVASLAFWLYRKSVIDPVKTSQRKAEESDTPTNSNLYEWSQMADSPYSHDIYYATSVDLLNWTDSNNLLARHASVPEAIYRNGIVYVYFLDFSEDGKPEQLALIRSSDEGKTWQEKTIANIEGLGQKTVADPSLLLLEDGTMKLFFFDIGAGRVSSQKQEQEKDSKQTQPNYIYSATSNDGVNFKMDDGYRFADNAIFDPDVIKVNDTWYLYCGKEGIITVATSDDGISFTDRGTAFDKGFIPSIYHDGSKFYLYSPMVGATPDQGGIGIATSADGIKFTRGSTYFNRPGSLPPNDPGVTKIGDNKYIMVYKVINEPTKSDEPKK
ncbi:MAG: hypothetical protein OEV37_03330 [Candidatus Berkelbacteria bacterium]|nr:hypothetical protein [Candidatus Berkelbacteria bacterium]